MAINIDYLHEPPTGGKTAPQTCHGPEEGDDHWMVSGPSTEVGSRCITVEVLQSAERKDKFSSLCCTTPQGDNGRREIL